MVMTLEPRPEVNVPLVRAAIRCDGRRKNGDTCGHLLARIEAEDFVGRIEFKCPKCHTTVVFE